MNGIFNDNSSFFIFSNTPCNVACYVLVINYSKQYTAKPIQQPPQLKKGQEFVTQDALKMWGLAGIFTNEEKRE